MTRTGSLSKAVGAAALALVGSTWGCGSSGAEARSAAFASETPAHEYVVPPANQPTPRAEVLSGEGIDVTQARREFSAAAHGLRACPNDGRVPVRLNIEENKEGRVQIHFADTELPQTFTAEGRRCILDAMSTIHVDDVASGGSPSNRPLGFTATVLVSW